MELNKKPLLTPIEAASRLNISKVTIYRLIEQRKIPFYKIGRSIRFSEEDIQNYLSKNHIKMITDYIDKPVH